jgi:tetratricopeptide (TPR) repeat protein
LNKAVELAPKDASGYAARATAHVANKDNKSAMADLDKAISMEPKLVLALLNRAQLHILGGAVDKAKADLQAALAAQPDNKTAKEQLAALSKS